MKKLLSVWALAMLLTVANLPAQEENAPPRRAAPPRRVQRGERLRKLAAPNGPLGQLFDSLTGDAAANPPLDVPQLNEGIVELLKPLLDEERGLEYLRLRFDPNDTNLARDTVHLVGATRLRKSAWSEQPTQVDLDLRANMRRREDGRPIGTLDGELRFQTDVVALANRAMTRLADRLERRAQQGAVSDGDLNSEQTFRLRMREKLNSSLPLANMDDVADLVLAFSGLRLTQISDHITELKAQLQQTPDERSRSELEQQLASARLQRDQMLEVRPQIERGAAGQAVGMRLALDRSQMDQTTRIEKLKIDITAAQVSVRLVGGTMQGMELYALFKPIVMNTLTRIQTRDPNTFQLGRGMFRGYLGELRGALGADAQVEPSAETELPPPPGAARRRPPLERP